MNSGREVTGEVSAEEVGSSVVLQQTTCTLQDLSIGVKPQQTAFKRPNKNSLDIISYEALIRPLTYGLAVTRGILGILV